MLGEKAYFSLLFICLLEFRCLIFNFFFDIYLFFMFCFALVILFFYYSLFGLVL